MQLLSIDCPQGSEECQEAHTCPQGYLAIYIALFRYSLLEHPPYMRLFRMGGRKNIERFSKDKDLASVRTLSMNLMKSELPLESSYCWPSAFLHMLGPFKPLPSTLFPTFLGESWLYLSRSSLGPSQPQQSSPC